MNIPAPFFNRHRGHHCFGRAQRLFLGPPLPLNCRLCPLGPVQQQKERIFLGTATGSTGAHCCLGKSPSRRSD